MTFEDIIKNDAEQLSKAMETNAAKFFMHEVNARKISNLNYQKYKRALTMSRYCYAMAHTEYIEYCEKVLLYMKWYEKWREIANRLKDEIVV